MTDTRRRDADAAAREAAAEAEAALIALTDAPSPETLSRAEAAEAAAEAACVTAAEAYTREGRGPVCDGGHGESGFMTGAGVCEARASVITVYETGEAFYQCDGHMTPGPHADTRYLSRAAEAAFNAYQALSEITADARPAVTAAAEAEALTARVRAAAEREAERAPAEAAAAVYDAVTRALTEALS